MNPYPFSAELLATINFRRQGGSLSPVCTSHELIKLQWIVLKPWLNPACHRNKKAKKDVDIVKEFGGKSEA